MIANDDSDLIGLFEECIEKDKAKADCLDKLQKAGLLRAEGK